MRSTGVSGYDGCRSEPSAAHVAIASVAFVVIVALASSGRAESWSARPTGPSDSAASIVCCTCIVNWPLTASPLFAPSHA